MLALSLSDKFCCFGIFVFVFNFFVLVLVLVNEFVIFSFFTIFVFVNENHTGENWVETRQNCLVLSCLVANCVHTADTDKTRQNSFVLSVSAVWTSYSTYHLSFFTMSQLCWSYINRQGMSGDFETQCTSARRTINQQYVRSILTSFNEAFQTINQFATRCL